MKWWVDLWLNEGFATWCEYWSTNELYPEYEIYKSFITSDFVSALSVDSLESSHPVEVNVTKAEQIDEIFDIISYQKGCVIVRMLVEFLGIETFRQGICDYLKKFKYANATTIDLWEALAKRSKRDVKEIIKPWTTQTGYPVVIVKEKERKGGKIIIEFEQKRYLASGKTDDTIWPIPLTYITDKSDKIQKVLMKEKKMTLKVGDDIEWIKLNPGLTGFYRVLYEKKIYDGLTKAIQEKKLDEIDRFSISLDVVDLNKARYLDIGTCLDILSSYGNEDTYTVLQGLVTSLGKIYNIIKYDEKISEKFDKFALSLFSKFKDKFGWETKEGMKHIEIFLQRLVISTLIHYGDKDKAKEAEGMFSKLDKISPDLKSEVLKSMVKTGGEKAYEEVKKLFETSVMAQDKIRCLYALGKSDDLEVLKKALAYGLSDKVKNQDKFYILYSICSNIKGRELVWEYFKSHFEELKKAFKGTMLLSRFAKYSSITFTSIEKAKEVEEFFKKNPIEGCEMTIKQTIEAITIKANWFSQIKEGIENWLNKKFP